MIKKISLIFLVLCFYTAGETFSQEMVQYSEGSQYIHRLSGPAVTPDGTSFYLKIEGHDEKVRLYDFDGDHKETVLNAVPENLSPDGRSYALFQSRAGHGQLRVVSAETGRVTEIAKVYQSNHFLGHRARKNLAWSPDSRQIAYVAGEKEPAEQRSGVRVYSRILYKTRTWFTDNVRTHIFVIPAEGGSPRQLTSGEFDVHSISWSPDGSKIAFISNRTEDPDDNHNNDVWTVDVETGKIAQMTDTPGMEILPVWSPDGKYLAYQAALRPVNTKDSQAENPHLMIMPSSGGPAKDLCSSLDRRIRTWKWSPDGRFIFFTADNMGARNLYRVSVPDGKIELVIEGEFRIGNFAVNSSGNRVVYNASSHVSPGEVWTINLNSKKTEQLTNVHAEFRGKVTFSKPETFWTESFDGTKIQGWLMKPNPYVEGRQYPVILTIHGGPHGAYGYTMSESNQKYAEEGFGVVYINPRGSSGYGQKFLDGTINNWGGGDYQDLMAGVDHVIAENSWIDAERLGVTGGSYGGYMTNWVITQTDRFKAAVTRASVSNLISFYGTSLYQLLIETEFPGELWDNYDLLWHWSPMKHVRNVTTPTLFIHGENDHDVPITQAEEMFIAIRKLGVESTLARYPGEGHGFRNPEFRRDSSERGLEWFKKYLKPDMP